MFKNEEKFEQTKDESISKEIKPDYKQSEKSGKVEVVFKKNRTYELYVGRNMYRFGPHESKSLDKSVIEHPDFKQVQEKYFVVKEV